MKILEKYKLHFHKVALWVLTVNYFLKNVRSYPQGFKYASEVNVTKTMQ